MECLEDAGKKKKHKRQWCLEQTKAPVLKEGAKERCLRPPPTIANSGQDIGFLRADGEYRMAHCQLLRPIVGPKKTRMVPVP